MRRTISHVSIALVTAFMLLPAAGTRAWAASNFDFVGSGNGHGLGMSQWGAEGLAELGWSYDQILTHFYRGTTVAPDASPPGRIRIGLTQDRTRVHLTAKNGPVKIWLGEAVTGTLIGTIAAGLTWKVAAKDTGYLVKDETGTSVGGKTWGGPSVDLILSYEEDGGRVFIPETDEIWGDGFSYSRGTIEFNLYGCKSGGCEERLIARLGFEEYLYGIGEVPASWPMAALRTQAVAARTYATYSLRHYGLRGSCNCNLTDGSGDQVYAGYVRESGTLGARWMNAVDTTAHEIVTYDGKVIQAFYSSSDGGHTENVEDVWHGGDPAFAIPWLRGVCDPGEWASGNSWLDWTRTFDADTLTARLAPYTGNVGTITTFRSIVRGRSGRIVSLKARGTGGSASLSGGELRAGLGLPDDRVWINADRNILGSIRVMYDELMCAPGLAESPTVRLQGGAQQFFEAGGIYRNKDVDLTVWLRGAIDAEFRAVGAGTGRLGLPVSTVQVLSSKALSCTRCKRVDFAGGRIYWKRGVGAHALWGPVLDRYLKADGPGGALGFPTSRVKRIDTGGMKARFEHGSIVCSESGSCKVHLA